MTALTDVALGLGSKRHHADTNWPEGCPSSNYDGMASSLASSDLLGSIQDAQSLIKGTMESM